MKKLLMALLISLTIISCGNGAERVKGTIVPKVDHVEEAAKEDDIQ